ncbi:complex III assembly factor LYRM7 [Cephus cinctus]|uniref:Complex III assembly factor LYRM7 n=1 Tax=Cephus cinctus TaxID=211228 RepID=A0AAJ7BWI5_CEPCN|nr:complex III assembly factor LYRM7 [Cephus cinctus]
MSGILRREVLNTFKKLHKTRLNTFKGDEHALNVTRKKINDEYAKYKHVTDEKAIAELNELAKAVEHEVRTTVIQAVEVEPGKFQVQLTKDTVMLDNIPDEAALKQIKSMRPGRRCSDVKDSKAID